MNDTDGVSGPVRHGHGALARLPVLMVAQDEGALFTMASLLTRLRTVACTSPGP